MRIAGEWHLCNDGVTRPVAKAYVMGVDGRVRSDRFLVDCGADRTVLCADFWTRLQLGGEQSVYQALGIGGKTPIVSFTSAVILASDEGRELRVRGQLFAFMDAAVTDMSILGRDVLDNFDVILSRRNNEVLILASNHHYRIYS